jgi:nicotinamide mononucleotide transporter
VEVLVSVLGLDWIILTVFEYPLSGIEALGILSGLLSVYLATKRNIFTWPTGIVNEFAFFTIFFQVQLYADMFLQVFFFVVTVYGWLSWKKSNANVIVRGLEASNKGYLVCVIIVGTLSLGFLMSHLHLLLPDLFTKPAAYPYQDAFTTTSSIIATFLLAKRYIENWYLWIIVDVVSVWLYFSRGIVFLSLLYCIFFLLASRGLLLWKEEYRARPDHR